MKNRRVTRAVALATAAACTVTATVAPAAPANAAQISIPGLPPIEVPDIQLPEVNPNFDASQAAAVAGALVSIASGISALIAYADKWADRPEPTGEYLSSLLSSDIRFQDKNGQQMFLLLNKEREAKGLQPLTWDEKQLKAANSSAAYQAKEKRLIRPNDLASTEVEIASTTTSVWAPKAYREWKEENESEDMMFEPTLQSGAIAFYQYNNSGSWYVVFRGSTKPAAKPGTITVDPLTKDELNAAASS